MKFCVSRCSAWAPGLADADAWQRWARDELQAEETGVPEAKAVPAMLRRRLTRWGRMALETASACADFVGKETPIIFSSRHGDTQRTCTLLQDLAVHEPLSPTAFSLSVHNASLGIYTIVQQALGPSLALAAGKETFAHAFLEAHNWLAGGADEVLLVHTDDVLADAYQVFSDERELPHSVALALTKHRGRSLELNWHAQDNTPAAEAMSLAFLRFWFNEKDNLVYPGSRLTWSWAGKDDGKTPLFG